VAHCDFLDFFGYTHIVVNYFEYFLAQISGATTNHGENIHQKLNYADKLQYVTDRTT
jgi:hypothetical protein